MKNAYLIWSNEHCGWWKPGRSGYTREMKEAGLYSRDEALRICRQAVLGSSGGVFNELPVRLEDMREFTDEN